MENILSSASGDHDQQVKENSAGLGAKIFAGFFSYLFHPVFVPLYITAFLVFVHPSAFSGFSLSEKRQTILIVALNIVFFPLFSVLLLKAVGFIESLYLRTQKDRIIPYIVSGIFFFWAYTVFKQQSQYPLLITSYIMGIFLASSVALIANIYFKISMHAIGMGGWVGFFLIILKSDSMLMTWPLCIALLITGLVCTSRLLLKSHDQKDIYMGLFVGLVTQFVAAFVVM
jgi:hypothetical protein